MVEHVIGNDGVVSPILTSGTIFDISAQMADFLFLNKRLFSPILRIFKIGNFQQFIGLYYCNLADSAGISFCNCTMILFNAFLYPSNAATVYGSSHPQYAAIYAVSSASPE